jgi:diguanylate cyclase (GGDEF)-like protein/PAS domain S-box-containing protein
MAASGIPRDIAFRVVHADGSVRHVLSHASTFDLGDHHMRGVVQDVTELFAAREGERETRAQYRYLFEHNPLPMWVFDRETLAFLAVNDAMLGHYGYAREELIGRSILEIRPAEERTRAEASALVPGEERPQGETWTHLRRDGSRLRAGVHVRDIEFEGRPARLVLAEDVTERERTEQRFQLVARATTDAVWDWDMERGVTWRSENVFQLFGYAPGEFGSTLAAWGELLHPDDREPVLARLQQAIDSGASEWQDDYRLRRKDGSYADVHDRGFILRDVDGQAVRAVGGMVDVSERQRMIEQLAYRATFDELTGLPNRQLLADRLRQALHTARRHERSVVVLFIDLDQLKLVNDSLGHAAGDELLRQVARRLQEAVRETDTLGRFGGDEFVAVLTEQTGDAGVGRVLERIGAALAEPVELSGVHHYVTASIGVASWPDAGDDAETLLKNADLAMYQAKLQGRNRAVAYHADFDAGVRDRLHLLSALRDALHREEFRLHFQPLFDRGGGPVGMEALVRWQHPERGLLAPGHFIGVCEDSGLIVPLGRWVLREAARHHRQLAGHGLGHLRISVNVSAAQFAHDLQADVAAVIDEFGLPAGSLELELTESLLMANPERAIETMRGLADRGVCMAIDDFGTGYSSLAYLKRLPLDRLKIDRSFVKDLGVDEDDAEICASIIGLGHSLGLTIVAEGVETPEQLAWLRARGCDEIQGYLLGRPQPFEALLAALQAMPAARAARGR